MTVSDLTQNNGGLWSGPKCLVTGRRRRPLSSLVFFDRFIDVVNVDLCSRLNQKRFIFLDLHVSLETVSFQSAGSVIGRA